MNQFKNTIRLGQAKCLVLLHLTCESTGTDGPSWSLLSAWHQIHNINNITENNLLISNSNGLFIFFLSLFIYNSTLV